MFERLTGPLLGVPLEFSDRCKHPVGIEYFSIQLVRPPELGGPVLLIRRDVMLFQAIELD